MAINSSNSGWNRRTFLQNVAAAGGLGLLNLESASAASEPPPEVTTIRLIADPNIAVLCYAPQYLAEELLRLEGFTDIQYVPYGPAGEATKTLRPIIEGSADMCAALGANWITDIDKEQPVTVLSGLHAGCIEVFTNDNVRSVRDIKGKRSAITAMESDDHVFIASVAAYIGLDPNRDIEWVIANPDDWAEMLKAGEVDMITTFPPMSYDMHAKNVGNVIINTTTDEPWRHYFCCMMGARQDFVNDYPIATKRALRAILKANQLCSLEPRRMAEMLIRNGFAENYEYALATLKDVPYAAWRDYDPDDTLRFFSLRLRDAGLISSSPQEIISRGSDWRFLNELKRELKA